MSNFKLRTGKYQGKTLDWIEDNDPRYLIWVEENRPEMLREKMDDGNKKVVKKVKLKPLTPNLDFDNEPIEWSDYAFNKNKKDEDDKWNF